MNCDIWIQTTAQRNYEFWRTMCGLMKRDPKTYQPLIDAKERWEKEKAERRKEQK